MFPPDGHLVDGKSAVVEFGLTTKVKNSAESKFIDQLLNEPGSQPAEPLHGA